MYWEFMHTLARVAGFHLHVIVIAADRLDTADGHRAVTPAGYTIRWGTKEDLLPFVKTVPGLDRRFLDKSFDRGDNCTVALHGDDLVGLPSPVEPGRV